MNSELFALAKGLLPKTYVDQAEQARKKNEQLIRTLLVNVSVPVLSVSVLYLLCSVSVLFRVCCCPVVLPLFLISLRFLLSFAWTRMLFHLSFSSSFFVA